MAQRDVPASRSQVARHNKLQVLASQRDRPMRRRVLVVRHRTGVEQKDLASGELRGRYPGYT